MKNKIVLSLLVLLAAHAAAQERYDGEPVDETFMMSVGGFFANNYNSKVRIDSTKLGLGTVINLEENLGVEKKVGVVKLDGFYRFNPRHRIEWGYISTTRKGSTEVLSEFQIGDNVYGVGSHVSSELRSNILKVDWSYSFINVKKYEAYVGFGLNIRKAEVKVEGNVAVNNLIDDVSASASISEYLPLPTFNVGFRYNFTDNLSLNYKGKVFALEYGDFRGQMRDTTLTLEHNTFENIGFGAGLNAFSSDIEATKGDFRGELESSYMGVLVYMKAYY